MPLIRRWALKWMKTSAEIGILPVANRNDSRDSRLIFTVEENNESTLLSSILLTFKFFETHGDSLRAQSSQSAAKSAKTMPGDSIRRFLCDLGVFAHFALKPRVHERWLRLCCA